MGVNRACGPASTRLQYRDRQGADAQQNDVTRPWHAGRRACEGLTTLAPPGVRLPPGRDPVRKNVG